jgi:phosphoribosylanthranilate isomerase
MVLNNLRQVQDTFIQNLLSKIIQLWTQISWKRLRMLKQLELMKVMSMILLQDKLKSLKEMKKMIKVLMIKNGKSTDKIIHA